MHAQIRPMGASGAQVPVSSAGRATRGRQRCAAGGTQQALRDIYPDDEAATQSFRLAYRHSAGMPEDVQIDGMQQFAAAIWDRQQHIPRSGKGPLDHIFAQFDRDGDGHLTPAEVAAALRSRHVDLTEEIVKKFVEASDSDNNSTVEQAEFAVLVLHMASADLRNRDTVNQHWEKEICDGDCEISWSSDEEDSPFNSCDRLSSVDPMSSDDTVMTLIDGLPGTVSHDGKQHSGSRNDSSA